MRFLHGTEILPEAQVGVFSPFSGSIEIYFQLCALLITSTDTSITVVREKCHCILPKIQEKIFKRLTCTISILAFY